VRADAPGGVAKAIIDCDAFGNPRRAWAWGDFDPSGIVDRADIASIYTDWGQSGSVADIPSDNNVDYADFGGQKYEVGSDSQRNPRIASWELPIEDDSLELGTSFAWR